VLNDLLQDLLLFARPKEPKTAPVAVMPLVEDTVHQLKRDPGMFGIEVSVSGDNPVVQADAGQLQRALLNLLINAGQAMQGSGRIEITVDAANGSCRIAFRDTGPGIPAEARERIFEPFFTTKHRGTGLGLPTSRRIVERHGGTLALETPEAGGTIARIVLPLE
jgi:signal transduction histidine kinase